MRYYSFHDGPFEKVTTISEVEIISSYWDYWYAAMCKKLGEDILYVNYAHEDCLQDWIVSHGAWERK